MLGFGWYAWDERCPSGKRCDPPLYGNFNATYIKVPANSPRFNGDDQAGKAVSAAVPWKAGIPRGNDICIKSGSRANIKDVAPLQKRSFPKKNDARRYHNRSHNNHLGRAANEISVKSKCSSASCNPTPSYVAPINSGSSTEPRPNDGKKHYYNVMWDTRVVRGSTSLRFEDGQRAKWKRQMDAAQAVHAREQIRRRRRKMNEEKYLLDTKSNPMRRLIYPTVTPVKEPLTKASFDLFLTEQSEPVKWTNESQVTDDSRPPLGQDKNSFYSGISISVQTEEDIDQREDTVNWIAKEMIGKIPEQAVLEVTEEAELDIVKEEQKRYELVFLYRKWQEMKENQWNEHLRAWNEIRMREILDQDAHLQNQGERIAVIGFCRNAISSCFEGTFEEMKQDGFISKHGIPYQELHEFEEVLDYREEAEEKFARKQLLARKVVDSALINAVVHRFSQHMLDDFGRPHGAWLYKRGRHESIAYDIDLQQYLENRWMTRREDANLGSLDPLYSESTLLNIFDIYKTHYFEEAALLSNSKTGHFETGRSKHRFGSQGMKKSTGHAAHGSADMKSGNKSYPHEQRLNSYEDDAMKLLYEGQENWLADNDQHQNDQQKKVSLKEGSSLAPTLSRTLLGKEGRLSSGSRGSSKAHIHNRESGEVDSDKLEALDGTGEKRRSRLSSATDS